jgi:diaminopimelate epimerase
MAAELAFRKYEGLGNDFIVVDAADERAVPAGRAPALCDRRFGVGADGVLLVLPPVSAEGVARMRVVNADGSVPEMCGNGVRCVALHVARARGVREAVLVVDTDAGPCRCAVTDRGDEAQVTVDMGMVRVLEDHVLDVADRRVAFTSADAGNPHAILFGEFPRSEVDILGPALSAHSLFARGTNVEFARVTPDGVDLVVWERGVGLTLACGTGACATAAVACAKGLAKPGAPIAVRLPGGRLDITVGHDSRVTMRGPARHVFSGVVSLG